MLLEKYIGANVFIRTVITYFTGRLVEVDEKFIRLQMAAWIADTGRFHNALANSKFDEVEPYVNDVLVSIGSIIDITTIDKLPTVQK